MEEYTEFLAILKYFYIKTLNIFAGPRVPGALPLDLHPAEHHLLARLQRHPRLAPPQLGPRELHVVTRDT